MIYASFSFTMWYSIDHSAVRHSSAIPIPIQNQWTNQNQNNSQYVHHGNNSKIQCCTDQNITQSKLDNGSHFINSKEDKLVKLLILAYPR